LQWEISLLRRSKWSVIQSHVLKSLKDFLAEQVEFEMFSEHYIGDVVQIFQDVLSEEYAHKAQMWAQECARGDAHAIDNLDDILKKTGRSSDDVTLEARDKTAQELVQGYVRREPDAMRVVNELLTDSGMSMDDLIAKALRKNLDATERIDRLITLTEGRRNAALREIERHRMSLAERLRRSVQQIEHEEIPVIGTTTANGKHSRDQRL
jgi:hypothetical protein